MLLYGVHTTYVCSGAVEHGQSGGLRTVLTCSWCVANFGWAGGGEEELEGAVPALRGLLQGCAGGGPG
jgi:hypothetical protein